MKLKFNYKQFAELRKHPNVVDEVKRRAGRIQQGARELGKGEYTFEGGAPPGSTRYRAFVATGNTRARRDQAYHDTLYKAIDRGRW